MLGFFVLIYLFFFVFVRCSFITLFCCQILLAFDILIAPKTFRLTAFFIFLYARIHFSSRQTFLEQKSDVQTSLHLYIDPEPCISLLFTISRLTQKSEFYINNAIISCPPIPRQTSLYHTNLSQTTIIIFSFFKITCPPPHQNQNRGESHKHVKFIFAVDWQRIGSE